MDNWLQGNTAKINKKPQYELKMNFLLNHILACMQYTHAGMQSHALFNRTHTHTQTITVIQAQICVTAEQGSFMEVK